MTLGVSTSLTGNAKMFDIDSKLWIMATTSHVAITNIENETAEAVAESSFSFLCGKINPIKVRLPTANTAHKSVTNRDSGKAQRVNVGTLGSPANSRVVS
jgi:hypothetical protein